MYSEMQKSINDDISHTLTYHAHDLATYSSKRQFTIAELIMIKMQKKQVCMNI